MAIQAFAQPEQKNVVINPGLQTVFFESQNLAYNYATGQWSRLPAVDGRRFFTVYDDEFTERTLGTIETATATLDRVMLQDKSITGAGVATATITTGDSDLNEGGITFVKGVRPLIDGGTWTVRVGSRDNLSTAISWSTTVSVTARSGYHDFRETGRYQRYEFTNSDGFNTAIGADVDAEPAGQV